VKFSCNLCEKTNSSSRNAWARQLATIFSHLIDSSSEASAWAIVFFELLMHCHGLYAESQSIDDKKDIWCLDKEFQKELTDKLKTMKTIALKRSRNASTPRRSINRSNCIKGKIGSSLKRNLFKSTIIESVPSMTFS
jgi:hypothetical protein